MSLGCTVRELKSRMTAAEFVEWMGFSLIEPFGDTRADERARGVMAMALVAQGAKSVDVGGFLKTWEPPREAPEQDAAAALLSRLDALAARSMQEVEGG